jgi:hypothetical protein
MHQCGVILKTINVPLILKVHDIFIFFTGKTYNGLFEAKENTPLYVLPQTKKKSPGLSKSEGHWYFYVPKREREREPGERE